MEGPGAPPTQDERPWATLARVPVLAAPLVAPLVILLVHQEQRARVTRRAKESLDFRITVTVAALALLPTVCLGVGIVLLALAVADLVLVVRAALDANGGREHRYPWTLRLVP